MARTIPGLLTSGVPRARAVAAAALLAGPIAACEDPTGPDANFLLRQPYDVATSSAVVTFVVSRAMTDSIQFEWEPAAGARTYAIAFWRVATVDQMNGLEAGSGPATLEFPVAAPRIVTVPYSTAPDDERMLDVVQFDLVHADIAAALQGAAMPVGEPLYFVWSVYAERGSTRRRSIELHRMVLILDAP